MTYFKTCAAMKQLSTLFLLFIITALSGCNLKKDCSQVIDKMTAELAAGNLTSVKNLADDVRRSCGTDKIQALES